MSSVRPLHSAHDFQTFIHVLEVSTIYLFTAFRGAFVFPPRKFPRTLLPYFWKQKHNIIVFSVVMATLLYHQCFAVILLLRRNSDAINQSYLRNFLAYIMKKDINHLALTIHSSFVVPRNWFPLGWFVTMHGFTNPDQLHFKFFNFGQSN